MGRSSIPPFPPALEARRSLQKMSGIEHLMIAVVSTAFDDLRSADIRLAGHVAGHVATSLPPADRGQ